jgi:hypothetical protein
MKFLHQRLQRAPANLAQVAVIVRHKLLAVADAVNADAYPTKIVIGFTKAAIADESRFRSHDRIRAVIGPAGKTKTAGVTRRDVLSFRGWRGGSYEREMQPVYGGRKFGRGGPLRAKHAISFGHGITRSSVLGLETV